MSLSPEKISPELKHALKVKNISLFVGLLSVAGVAGIVFDYHATKFFINLENETEASYIAMGLIVIAIFAFFEAVVKADEIEDILHRNELLTHISETEKTEEQSEADQKVNKPSKQKSPSVLSFQYPRQECRG